MIRTRERELDNACMYSFLPSVCNPCIVTPFGIQEGLFGSLSMGGKMLCDRFCSFKMTIGLYTVLWWASRIY